MPEDRIYPPQPPSFLINGVPGWDSRVIYSYPGVFDYTNYIDRSLLNILSNETYNGFGRVYKGVDAQRFDQIYYEKSGKNIKITGRFFIRARGGDPFMFNFGIRNTIISKSNGGAFHYFNEALEIACPVDFEIIVSTYYGILADEPVAYYRANGCCQYNYSNHNNTGDNSGNVYIPIYATGGATQATPFELSADTGFNINLLGSEVTAVWLAYLYIEELN
jgi:hypothetical protein